MKKDKVNIVTSINQDKLPIYCNEKIIWHDLDKKGNINERLNKQAVVYIYKHTAGNISRYYVGSSVNMLKRMCNHRYGVTAWKEGKRESACPIFYDAILLYGWDSFKFGVLEHIGEQNEDINNIKEVLKKREQSYLDNINPSLNLCKIANSPLGVKRSEMFSLNLSRARRGHRNKPAIKNHKPHFRPETLLKLSARSIGIKVKILDKFNNIIKEFSTLAETAKYLGVSDRTVSRIMKSGLSYDDYTYKFEAAISYPIVVVNKMNNTVKEYPSIRAVAKDILVGRECVSKYINTDKLLKGVYLISKNLSI